MVKQPSFPKFIIQTGLINLLNVIVGHFDNFDQLYWMQCDGTLCVLVRLIIVSLKNTHIIENLTDNSNLDQLNSKIRSTRALNDY